MTYNGSGAPTPWSNDGRFPFAAKGQAMTADKYDALFDNDEADILDLMGAVNLPDVGVWHDGYLELREVRVTPPWQPSLVRRDERPRVALSVITRKCDHCHETYTARRQSSRYCGAACRMAVMRSTR